MDNFLQIFSNRDLLKKQEPLDIILNIENGLSKIDNKLLKWKSDLDSQAVFFGKKYVYKIYVDKIEDEFNCYIRSSIAKLYRELGIDWEISIIKNEKNIITVERREYIDNCNNDKYSIKSILLPWKTLLKQIEQNLLNDILKQLQKYFPEIASIKLIRECIFAKDDYGIYKNNIILLDDADFALLFLDKNNNIISKSLFEISQNILSIENNNFKLISIDNKNLTKENIDRSFCKFKLVKVPKEKTTFKQLSVYTLLQERERNILDQINLLIDKDTKIQNNKKSYQWELWSECNSKCNFCYLGKENTNCSIERHIKSLIDLNKAIDSLDFNIYDNVSLIGGEFFQGQLKDESVRYLFYTTLKKLFTLYHNNKLNSMWITATLTIGDQKDLYELLNMASTTRCSLAKPTENSGLWICTSWDSKGRFHTDKMRENWEYHMKKISKDYPWVKKNTTIILSKPFIEEYLNGEIDLRKFQEEFKTSLFFKQPGVFSISQDKEQQDSKSLEENWLKKKEELNKYIGFDFYPTRNEFIKFLSAFKANNPELFPKLFNIQYRADELHRNFNNEDHDTKVIREKTKLQSETAPFNLPCGHVCNYACYIDNNKCCLCDKEIIESE